MFIKNLKFEICNRAYNIRQVLHFIGENRQPGNFDSEFLNFFSS